MNQFPVLPVLPLLPVVLVQRRRRSASVWPDGAPPSPHRRANATTPAFLSPGPGPGPGRRSAPQHRYASALAAAARPGEVCSCAEASASEERPRSSTSTSTSSRRPRLRRRSWRPTRLGLVRYLRKISRRLRKHYRRSISSKGYLPTSSMAAVAVDDTTRRERAEAVARAISYCKDTLRRRSSSVPPPPTSPPLPPSSPSPSFDDWLDDRDRQEEVKAIATSAAEQLRDDDCGAARDDDVRPSLTRRPRPRRDRETSRTKRFKELPCPAASPSREGYSSLATTAAVTTHGEESSSHHAHGCRGESSMSSGLDELEFLKTFDGDEEVINRHFITLEIPRSSSQVFRKQSLPYMKRKRLDMDREVRVRVVVPSSSTNTNSWS